MSFKNSTAKGREQDFYKILREIQQYPQESQVTLFYPFKTGSFQNKGG